jgi:hypothetical protein
MMETQGFGFSVTVLNRLLNRRRKIINFHLALASKEHELNTIVTRKLWSEQVTTSVVIQLRTFRGAF